MEFARKLIDSYEKWVAANPETVGDVEATTKWVSFLVAGRISNSSILSELVYALSNMLVFYNDRIIDKTHPQGATVLRGGVSRSNNSNTICYRLKVMLTTLEYCEVFIEISAKRLFGERGKWLLVVCVQLFKAIGRFFILKNSTDHIITSPSIPTLNRGARSSRNKLKNATNPSEASSNGIGGIPLLDNTGAFNHPAESAFTFQLKRSGRVMRKVEGAPPLQLRDFKNLNELADKSCIDVTSVSGNIVTSKKLLMAEYVYIAKPLIHLASMGMFGNRHWHQFIVALAMDLASIRMYHQHRHLMTKEQKLEMSKRCSNLLMYLVRSPFYESLTQTRIERTLDFIADHIPLARLVAAPLKTYLPHWQSTYFYLWST